VPDIHVPVCSVAPGPAPMSTFADAFPGLAPASAGQTATVHANPPPHTLTPHTTASASLLTPSAVPPPPPPRISAAGPFAVVSHGLGLMTACMLVLVASSLGPSHLVPRYR
jgi:hypothetical protein